MKNTYPFVWGVAREQDIDGEVLFTCGIYEPWAEGNPWHFRIRDKGG